MKKHRPAHSPRMILILFLCLCICQNALAGVLTLPAGTKVIEEEAFYGDQSIDEVVLPEGVEEIGPRAFEDSSINKVNLPDSLTEIAEDAFDLDDDIEISANEGSYAHEWLKERGYQPPELPSPVTDFEFTGNANGTCTLSKYIGKEENVVIPEKDGNGRIVTSIGKGAFEDCNTLGSVTIPNSVTSIELFAFYGSSLRNITIPDSVTNIGYEAFCNCKSLTNIKLPAGMTKIDWYAFYLCSSLRSITVPEGVTSIEEHAFDDCSSLTSITIPESVTSIGRNAFDGCKSLTSITIPEGVTSLEDSVFCNCSSLTSITIPENVTCIEEHAFFNCSSLTSVKIPENVRSIGSYAFNGCKSLTSITIPGGVTRLEDSVFGNCSSLTSITIPENVTYIGENAFSNCSSLTSITIPESVTSISGSAFWKCSSLTSITIPEGVTNIGYGAFSNCSSLKGIIIPESVTSIGDYAFYYCNSLTSITIPESVTSIGDCAFFYCNSLTSITVPDSVTNIGNVAFYDFGSLSSIYCSEESYAWIWFENNGFSSVLIPWDGDSSTLPEIHQLFGSFTNHSMTIALDDLLQTPAAMVKSTGKPISRVTLTINNWNQDGTNANRYRTRTFDGQNLQEISLSDPEWASDFTLDTTQEPLNTPGEYTINLWASTVETDSTGIRLDSMTVYIGWTSYLTNSHIGLYSEADSAEPGVYLDSSASALIIGENGSRYHIRTEDGSLWWVEKRYIGTDENQVTVTVAAEKSGQAPYAHVQGSATAAGGNAPYQYTFSLYKGNAPVLTTDLQDSGEYAFDIIQPGTYSVQAMATDADGKTGKAFSASFEITNRESVSVSGRVLSDTGNSLPSVSVTIREGENTAYTGLTDASGSWTWNGASAGKTYTVAYAKEGMSFGEPVSFTVEQAWNLVLEPVYAEGAGNAVWSQSQGLHGLALADDGSPMEGIPVSLTTENSTAARVTWTDFRGQWAFSGLTDGTVYTVTYGGGAVHANPGSESVTFSADSSIELQTVIGSITGDESSSISFSMAPKTVTVHGSVAFEIHVPDNTAAVRLVVDGKPYDVFAAENGQAYLTRVFNKSGNRKVAFQISPDGTAWTEISAVKNLEVTSYGPPLDAPVIEPVAGHTTGSPLTVRWGNVTNAEEYVIYLSRNGEAVDRLTTENLFIEIPDYDFELPGSYTVLVMGTGTGYDQSEAAIVVDVVAKDYTLSITEANNCADRGVHEAINVHISQNFGYILLKIETPSGTIWYPGAGALIPDNEFSHSIETPEAGSYSITPYLYTISPMRNNSVPFMTGRTIQVSVNGPAIKTVLPGGNDWTWLTEFESRTIDVTTNTGVETVSVYESTELLGTKVYSGEVTSSGARLFTVTLDHALTAGRHTVTVKATSADGKLETTKEKQFYVVHTVTEPYTVYAQAELLELTSSPLLSARTTKTVATVCGGTNVEALTCIGEAGDFLQVRKQAETSAVPRQATGRAVTEGFAPAGSLAPTVWSGASGTLTLIKPGSDLSLPQGTHALLEVSWNCGVAVPTGSVFEISLTPLVGTSPVKVTTSAPGERISVTTLEADEYTLQVKLLQGNTVLAASETRKINIGNFSLEEAYRSWWLQHNSANYTSYLENGEPFDEKVSAWHGWGGFIPLNVRGMRPTIIFEPATLAYKQMLEDFKDLDKDAHVNTVENIHLVIQDEAQLRRTALINIAEAMLEEKEAGNLMLKEDMSNVSGVAQSNQTISVRQSWAQVIMDSIKAIISGSKIGLNIYKFSNPAFEPEPFNNCLDFIGAIADIAEDAWMGYLEEWAILYNLNASADQYATLLGKACDAYVKCLEETYLGDDWDTRGTYSSYVKEYIDKFKEMKADPDRLHEIALNQILEGTGYTPAQLLDMESECICEAASEAMMSDIGNAMVLAVNIWAKTEYNITVNILKYDDGAISINPEVATTLINEIFQKQGKELKQDLRDQLTEKMNEALKRKNKNWRKDIAEFKEKIRDVEGKLGALDCVLSSAVDAWELGVTLGELGQSASRLSEQGNNKGWFDTYGLNLVLTLKLRQEAYITGGLRSVNWDREGATISIEELEKFRNTLVSLTNYDLSILRNYHAMRLINDSNGFKFKYGLEWMTPADIQRRISLVSTYREMFLERPSVFDPLFE